MIKKEIKELAKSLDERMYITENRLNVDARYSKKAKYFIKWHNTHNIVSACETQKELSEEIKRYSK
jgi:hypothetical protein